MTISTRTAMDRFVRRENLKHYRELLKAAKSEEDRQRVLKLLSEEEQKQRDAGDDATRHDTTLMWQARRFEKSDSTNNSNRN